MKFLSVSRKQLTVSAMMAIAVAVAITTLLLSAVPLIAVAATIVQSTSSPSSAPTSIGRPAAATLDDSATVVLDPVPRMNWRNLSPKNRDNTIVGKTRVNVKLATAAWLGKRAKIYMLMPAETAGAVQLTWRGTGQLLDGQLKSGARTLVFSGVIRNSRIEDVLSIEIEADGTRISRTQQLQIYYEIEVE